MAGRGLVEDLVERDRVVGAAGLRELPPHGGAALGAALVHAAGAPDVVSVPAVR